MSHEIRIITITSFLLLGFFLIGIGISGFAVSESCCFTPNCSAENICEVAKLGLNQPQNNTQLYLGILVILISSASYIFFIKHKN